MKFRKALPREVKVDLKGFPYRVQEGFAYRVSHCCFAPTSVDEYGTFYCKKCYKATPAQIEMPPVLAGGGR